MRSFLQTSRADYTNFRKFLTYYFNPIFNNRNQVSQSYKMLCNLKNTGIKIPTI